jgi:hypothetical protein
MQLNEWAFKRKTAWDFFIFREGEYAKIICRILLYADRLKLELSLQLFNQNRKKTSWIFLDYVV